MQDIPREALPADNRREHIRKARPQRSFFEYIQQGRIGPESELQASR